MKKQFEILKTSRQFLLNYINSLSIEQLNKTPEGFNNNIVWNLAHIIVAQQGVCYKRGGHKMLIDEDMFELFKPGTVSPPFINEQQVKRYKELLITTIEQTELDYQNGLFSQNPAWKQSMGIDVENIEQSITFLLWHEGLHIGTIMSLKKIV